MADTVRKMPVRILPWSFEWEGVRFSGTVRTNVTFRELRTVAAAAGTDELAEFIYRHVVGHDFVDEAGEPLRDIPASGEEPASRWVDGLPVELTELVLGSITAPLGKSQTRN